MTTSPDTPTTVDSPLGGTVPVVSWGPPDLCLVPKGAEFEFRYNGHDFFTLTTGELVAVAR